MEPSPAKIVQPDIDIPALCQAISEASPVPMAAVTGSDHIIRYVNPAFCVLANEHKDDLIGKRFSDAIAAGDDCRVILDRVYRSAHAETYTGEEHSRNSLGWSYTMWPALAASGEIAGIMIQVTGSTTLHERITAMNQALIIGSLQQNELTEKAESLNVKLNAEISDRKRTEKELLRVNADLERFNYAASHDLQEPLRTVTIYTELLALRLGADLDADAQLFVKYIFKGASRMKALIEDLLVYSKLGVEERQGLAPTDCAEAVEGAMLNLNASVQELHAVITVDSLPVLHANLPQLVQVFQNLIGNALKYHKSDAPPKVHISAERRDGEWKVSVRDDGIGFKPQYAEQIFGVFKRLHSSEYPGTGVGLAICKRIVELHGGRIWATGEEGSGATFFFTLPEATDRPENLQNHSS